MFPDEGTLVRAPEFLKHYFLYSIIFSIIKFDLNRLYTFPKGYECVTHFGVKEIKICAKDFSI